MLRGKYIPDVDYKTGIIVNGNHRYIASRLTGFPLGTTDWGYGRPQNIVEWQNIIIETVDWGGGPRWEYFVNSEIPVITLPYENLNNKILEDFDGHRALLDNIAVEKLSFINSDLRNAIFNKSIIKKSKFINSKLIMTQFNDSRIEKSDFVDCYMNSTDFENSILKNICFKNCNMNGVNFSEALLFNVSLETSIGIETSIFNKTYYNKKTKFPNKFDLNTKNLIFVDNYVNEKYIELEKRV